VELSQKEKTELPYDLTIPVPGIYPRERKSICQRDICPSMFIAALFTITKKWNLPLCPSTDASIEKIRYIHTMEYYSAIRKN
jgi:hypothetical protein